MAVFIAVIALAGAIIIGNPALWFAHPDPGPVQTIYRDGVPHTDRHGRPLDDYHPSRSFFPIGLYHSLHGDHHGRRYSLFDVAAAGFNSVHFWEGQAAIPAVEAAAAAGLQAVVRNPTPEEVRQLRQAPAVLGWYLDEEPTLRAWDPDWQERLDQFHARRAEIRAIDPTRPVFAIDSPFIDPPWRERWLAWVRAGDVAAHWNYPVRRAPLASLSGRRGVPESVADAVRESGESKPVWLVVQAFGSPHHGWVMPQPRELRAAVFAGIVHGATGIFYFALDSFVTRDGQVIGVSADPRPTYGLTPDYNQDGLLPLDASPEDMERSRTLWREIVVLNRELAALAADILSPTATVTYEVASVGAGAPGSGSVRTLMKRGPQGPVLIAVNLDAEPATIRFQVDGFDGLPEVRVGPFRLQRDGAGWVDTFDPFDVRVYGVSEGHARPSERP